MIELSRAQDEEVGDGTTSVIILAGEVLAAVESFIEREIHPTVIVSAYFRALEDMCKMTEELGVSLHFYYLWQRILLKSLSVGSHQHGE